MQITKHRHEAAQFITPESAQRAMRRAQFVGFLASIARSEHRSKWGNDYGYLVQAFEPVHADNRTERGAFAGYVAEPV